MDNLVVNSQTRTPRPYSSREPARQRRAMNFQIDVSSSQASGSSNSPKPGETPLELVNLLRQILEVQREQLAYQKAAAAAQDVGARWRAFLTRWQEDLPGLADGCRKAIPHLERTYGQLIHDLTEILSEDEDPLDTDFALQEFLDRFGMRLTQLGTILNLVAPLAEAGAQLDAGAKDK